MISKKLDQILFKIWRYTFLIFEKGDQHKIGLAFLRLVSILLLIFEKADKRKIGPGSFKISKSTFYNIWKSWSAKYWARFFFKISKHTFFNLRRRWSAKNWTGFFKVCKYTLFNIWKRWSAKNWTKVFSRFVSILLLIFENGIS